VRVNATGCVTVSRRGETWALLTAIYHEYVLPPPGEKSMSRNVPPDNSRPRIQVMAHRGLSSRYPENTVLAFAKALELDIDSVEFDVHRTRDGALVVIHDAKLDRTTDGNGPVADRTLAELKALDAGSWKATEFAGERIPTLDETLDVMARRPGIMLNVEIKDTTAATADASIAALRRRGILSNCVLTCFNAAVLAHIKRQDSAIKVQGFPARMMSNFAPEPHGTYSQMDYVGIHIGDATAELGESFRRMGIVPGVWVVDDPAVAAKAVAMGMAIITSNAPDQILPVVRAVPTADARG